MELLDGATNRNGGRKLDENIWKERVRLYWETEDARWLWEPIWEFEDVVVVGSPPARAGRWRHQQIVDGEHLQAYQKHTGQSPDPNEIAECLKKK